MALEQESTGSSSGVYSDTSDSESVQSGSTRVLKKLDPQIPAGYKAIAPSLGKSNPPVVSALTSEETNSGDLWVIRLPTGLKPKHVAGLKLDLSSVSKSNPSSGPHSVGQTTINGLDYDIFAECVPTDTERSSVAKNRSQVAPETNEVSQLTSLIPDQGRIPHQSQMIVVPRSISRVIFFRRRIPSNMVSNLEIRPAIFAEKAPAVKPTVKRPQPPGLKLRNIPYGANSQGVEHDLTPCNQGAEPPKPADVNLDGGTAIPLNLDCTVRTPGLSHLTEDSKPLNPSKKHRLGTPITKPATPSKRLKTE